MKKPRIIPLLLFLGTIMTIISSHPIWAAELAPHLHKTTLDNGLTVITRETPGNKAVTVQIWVRAGSVYEEPTEAGITHLIEHMIFKGTKTQGPGQIAGAIEELGGKINAYTSYEHTVYHATLSARHFDKAMEVLADAVLHSVFDAGELEREKKVVLEEISMRNDKPTIKLFEGLMASAYTKHPYRNPVIGSVKSVSGITRDMIQAYIGKHYRPENFTVVVVGDIQVDKVTAKVQETMGAETGTRAGRPEIPKEPVQETSRNFALREDINQSHLALAFPIPAFSDKDTPVLDVISAILGHGEASRLYHQLRDEKRLVYQIDVSAFAPHDPGLMEVTATLEAANLKSALEAILLEFFRLKHFAVPDEELDRVKRNLESEFIFNMERVEGQARVLGSFELLTGDPREHDYIEKLRAVSKEDIRRVAATYFTQSRITVGSLIPKGASMDLTGGELSQLISRTENLVKPHVPPSGVVGGYLPDMHHFTLKNGIHLLVREDSSVPTVSIRAVFPGGLLHETSETNGAFAFLADLLPKGTQTMPARELALKIADMAGDVSGFNGKNTFGVKAEFLPRFFRAGLGIVRDVVRSPALAKEEAEKIRPELLDQLRQQEDNLSTVAFREFNRILFDNYPYALNTAGNETAIKDLTVKDLKELYEQHARPDRMVLAVAGAVKADDVWEAVESMFGDWQPAEGAETDSDPTLQLPQPPASPKVFKLARDKEQVHIILGFMGLSIKSEERYALEVLDMALSGQSGRLFTELRDKQSLAYSVSSFSLLGLDTGSVGVYIGTNPEKRDNAIQALWREISQVREELLSEAELRKAKNSLISNYELSLQTHGAQAMDMALSLSYDLGLDFGNRYVDRIGKVTTQEVRDVARKYLLPENYVLVMVGAEPGGAKKDTKAGK